VRGQTHSHSHTIANQAKWPLDDRCYRKLQRRVSGICGILSTLCINLFLYTSTYVADPLERYMTRKWNASVR
jgi:hypothetical protein